jgi:large subunit ribosomal protein L10
VRGDAALAAKALDGFSRRADVLVMKGGILEGRILGADEIRQLARLPSRDVLTAQFAGVVASPITGLVRGLGSMVAGLAVALAQVRDKKEAESPEPAAEAPAAEAAEQPADDTRATEEPAEPSAEVDESGGDEQQAEQSEAE